MGTRPLCCVCAEPSDRGLSISRRKRRAVSGRASTWLPLRDEGLGSAADSPPRAETTAEFLERTARAISARVPQKRRGNDADASGPAVTFGPIQEAACRQRWLA